MWLRKVNSPAVTIVPSGESMTFGELDEQSMRFASALRTLRVQPGGKVALLMDNRIEYPVVLRGAQRGGYDHLPLNTHATNDELHSLLSQFAPAVVVVSEAFTELASKLRSELDAPIHWVMVGSPREGWLNYEALLAQSTEWSAAPATKGGKLLLLSGGSTGCPKIVERPYADDPNTPRQSVALAHMLHSAESVILVSAPLYHTGPLGWLLGGLEVGAHVVVMERWDAARQLEAVQRFGVTHMPLVPTMMSRLLELPYETRASFDLSTLVAVSHSAAPCSLALKRRFMEWIPALWSGYSMTESFGLTVISPDEWLAHPGSVGRAVSWCDITIRDEAGAKLPPGETGVVWFRRHDKRRMQYFGNPSETAASYNAYGEGTSFDLGYMDGDGYLYLTGRSKNMIIVGGVNIYPSSIENVLAEHPLVADACVIGQPHEEMGEVPVAVVELVDGSSVSAHEDALTDYCRTRLGGMATPQKIVFAPRLPRTPTGKIRRGDIAALVSTLQ
jgi:long-chain acyl-CoA synthetase